MNFLKKLVNRGCSHRFSWPRVDADGRHYQVCLACGAAYEYDWRKMRQTGRLLTTVVPGSRTRLGIAAPLR
jgi:hypothetical protein